jgi:hypothetical protein
MFSTLKVFNGIFYNINSKTHQQNCSCYSSVATGCLGVSSGASQVSEVFARVTGSLTSLEPRNSLITMQSASLLTPIPIFGTHHIIRVFKAFLVKV